MILFCGQKCQYLFFEEPIESLFFLVPLKRSDYITFVYEKATVSSNPVSKITNEALTKTIIVYMRTVVWRIHTPGQFNTGIKSWYKCLSIAKEIYSSAIFSE